MKTYGPHLTDFYDLPPREPSNRTPRIIGRLTEAGALLRDRLAVVPYVGVTYKVSGKRGSLYEYGGNRQPDRDQEHRQLLGKMHALACALTGPMIHRAQAQLSAPCSLDASFGIDFRPLVPHMPSRRFGVWHIDPFNSADPEIPNLIIGDREAIYNTEYAAAQPTMPLTFNGHPIKPDQQNILLSEDSFAQLASTKFLNILTIPYIAAHHDFQRTRAAGPLVASI